jgi:glycosyltransferase involved in cell wall biosynthesis
MDRISIIVPTYNRKGMLQRLLESFGKLQCHCPLEFIIVDDCSDDGTGEIVEDWKATIDFADVKYHRLSSRSGPARARNAGIVLSTGNILAFTDSDCKADPLWVEQLYRRLTSRPEYAGAGGRVLPLHDDIYSTYNTVFRCLEPPRQIEAIIGANCMFKKQPVIDAGVFDEYFFHPGGEEIALCMKLWIKGYRFGFEEQAVVYHDYRQNLRDFIRTFYHYGVGEQIILTNRPTEYFQYMQYPEKMHNYIAFKNSRKFLVFFFLHLVYGTFMQHSFLAGIPLTRNTRLKLNGMYGIHQLSYHLGRGTVFGVTVREVRDFRSHHPERFHTLDQDTDGDPVLLDVTADTIPAVMKPGERKDVSITIKNVSDHLWLSGVLRIVLSGKDNAAHVFETPAPEKMIFFPGTEVLYHFRLKAPQQEQVCHVQVYLSSSSGVPLSSKKDKKITVSSESGVMDAEIAGSAFPKTLIAGQQVQASVIMKNTGSVTWNREINIWLEGENGNSGTAVLFGDPHIVLPVTEEIPPGNTARFLFMITAPFMPGEYVVRYHMGGDDHPRFGKLIEQRIEVKAR